MDTLEPVSKVSSVPSVQGIHPTTTKSLPQLLNPKLFHSPWHSTTATAHFGHGLGLGAHQPSAPAASRGMGYGATEKKGQDVSGSNRASGVIRLFPVVPRSRWAVCKVQWCLYRVCCCHEFLRRGACTAQLHHRTIERESTWQHRHMSSWPSHP